MARPRGKLFALLAIFAAIGLVTASGAFTSVSADRTVTVNVANDDTALLGLEGNTSSGNAEYVTTENGQVVINLDQQVAGGGQGINKNATTRLDHLLNVSNQGPNTVDVTAELTGGSLSGVTVSLYDSNSGDDISPGTGSTELTQGTQTSLGLEFVTTDQVATDTFNMTITINATAQ